MSDTKRFLPPIPPDHQVFETELEVAAIHLWKADAIAFGLGLNQSLEFEPEPTNSKDPNALRILGTWTLRDRSASRMIGYVPRTVAGRIAAGRFPVVARLKSIWMPDGDYIVVRFDVLGKKADKRRYDDIIPAEPYSRPNLPDSSLYAPFVPFRVHGGRVNHVGFYDSPHSLEVLCTGDLYSGHTPTVGEITCRKCNTRLPTFMKGKVVSACASCQMPLRIPRAYIGKAVACKSCGHQFRPSCLAVAPEQR